MTYLYMEEEPLYRFGYGLSYTTFEKKVLETGADRVTVSVKNTGDRTSDCVVQVYACPDGGCCLYEDRCGPGNRLTAFTRLKDMKPGEERSITL